MMDSGLMIVLPSGQLRPGSSSSTGGGMMMMIQVDNLSAGDGDQAIDW